MQPGGIFFPWYSVKRGKLSELIHWDSGFEEEPSPDTRCSGFSLPSSGLRVLGQEFGPGEGWECCVCSSLARKCLPVHPWPPSKDSTLTVHGLHAHPCPNSSSLGQPPAHPCPAPHCTLLVRPLLPSRSSRVGVLPSQS